MTLLSEMNIFILEFIYLFQFSSTMYATQNAQNVIRFLHVCQTKLSYSFNLHLFNHQRGRTSLHVSIGLLYTTTFIFMWFCVYITQIPY